MAGHSQFKNIMHRKGVQDKRKAKLFTKIIKEVAVAARASGIDPSSNPRLRSAITTAKGLNVPKSRLDAVLKRLSDNTPGECYEEIRYEGYGPGGIALILDILTDNRNRTASEIRSTFTKYGGILGETDSVTYLFTRMGYIEYPRSIAPFNTILESAIDAETLECEEINDCYEITCSFDALHNVRTFLEPIYGEPREAKIIWSPIKATAVALDFESATKILKLVESLEDNDDVQSVTGNYAIPEDVMKRLYGG